MRNFEDEDEPPIDGIAGDEQEAEKVSNHTES